MSTRNRTSQLPPSTKTSTSTKKFELPALPLDNFGSLTDGTDIPPPERELTPSPAPEAITLPASSSASAVDSNGAANGRKPSQISIAGTDATRPDTPNGDVGMLSPVMSPISPNRPPSSMKRFLSRKSMNADYNHSSQSQRNTSMSTTTASDLPYSGPSRPESSLSFVSNGGTKTKKKRSWWQKLMGSKEEDEKNGSSGNGTPLHKKRTSTVMEKDEPKEVLPPRKKGPPPPKLPELRDVRREGQADGGFGGDDMFSNIR